MKISHSKIEYYNTANKHDFLNLLQEQRIKHNTTIKLITFNEITNWTYDEQEGNLKHETNGFFKIQSVRNNQHIQPIINQAEHGILGLIIKNVDGVLYCLVQFKIEPGNKNIIQISPTVQATESNYKGLHKGKKVKFIDYFINENVNHKVVYKQLQSEQGSKFFKKKNWNIILHINGEIDEKSPNHYWVSISLINDLLKLDNVINMDLRSILSSYDLPKPFRQKRVISEEWLKSVEASSYNFNNEVELRNKIELSKKNKHNPQLHSLKLALENGWHSKKDEIINLNNPNFVVKFINVKIQNREVSTWSQPIVASNAKKINCFYVKKIKGVYHYLIQFCHEIGLTTYAEIGPTFHNVEISAFREQHYANLSEEGKVLYEATLSEEGGRFYHEENLYRIIELPEHLNIELLPSYYWATMYSLKALLKESCNINIEARTILSVFDWRQVGYEEN